MVTRAVARRGSAEKSEYPWGQRLGQDQNHCDLLATGTATQKHTNTLKALLQLNHLVFLEEMTEKHNSRKTRLRQHSSCCVTKLTL